jgi:hypothetical protein
MLINNEIRLKGRKKSIVACFSLAFASIASSNRRRLSIGFLSIADLFRFFGFYNNASCLLLKNIVTSGKNKSRKRKSLF